MQYRERERGVARTTWLMLAVLAAVISGATINRCLTCDPPQESVAAIAPRGAPIASAIEPEPIVETPEQLPAEPPPPEPITETPVVETPAAEDGIAEEPTPENVDEDLFLTLTFDTLASWLYKHPDEGVKTARPDAVPGHIRRFDGRKISIRGFMIPIKLEGEEVTELLLVRNQYFCCFGRVPKMNEWIHVIMEPGKVAPYAQDVPITVMGTLSVGELLENGVVMSLFRIEASKVTEPAVFQKR